MNVDEARAWTEDWIRGHRERDRRRVEVMPSTINLSTVQDGRGGIWTYLPALPIVEYNLIVSRPGAMRGMHWHPNFEEYLMVVDGLGVLVAQDIEGGPIDTVQMAPGVSTRCPIGVAHTLYAVDELKVIAALTRKWDDSDPPIVYFDPTVTKLVPEHDDRDWARRHPAGTADLDWRDSRYVRPDTISPERLEQMARAASARGDRGSVPLVHPDVAVALKEQIDRPMPDMNRLVAECGEHGPAGASDARCALRRGHDGPHSIFRAE